MSMRIPTSSLKFLDENNQNEYREDIGNAIRTLKTHIFITDQKDTVDQDVTIVSIHMVKQLSGNNPSAITKQSSEGNSKCVDCTV